MKIMIVNSQIKQKSKIIVEKIRNVVLDFIIYCVTAYIIWESTLYMLHDHRVKHQIYYVSLEEVSKKNYDKQFIIVTTHKSVQNYYNEKCAYNVNTHRNLLYALKIWNCLNFIQKRSLIFCLSCYLLKSDL